METVQSDLRRYLQKNIFPSRTVLVFPPFNGFRRFLIHKLIEDNFASSEVAAFSIGQEISRRIVICYKGLISDAASKGLPATIPQPCQRIMIDKEKSNRQRQTPTAAVYRPPAARQADNRRSTEVSKPLDSRQARVRRPDQQVYVPRPKRASYGSNLPRSRSRSNSRLSLDSDHSLDVVQIPSLNSEESSQNGVSEDCHVENILPSSVLGSEDKPDISAENKSDLPQLENEISETLNNEGGILDSNPTKSAITENSKASQNVVVNKTFASQSGVSSEKGSEETVTNIISRNFQSGSEKEGKMQVDIQNVEHSVEHAEIQCKKIVENDKMSIEKDTPLFIYPKANEKVETVQENNEVTPLETISISSESKSEDSNSSFRSCSDSNTSNSSVDSKVEKKLSMHKSLEQMEIDHFEISNVESQLKGRSQQKEDKTKKTVEPSSTKISEVLVISDSSSGDDSMKSVTNKSKKNNTSKKFKSELSASIEDVKVTSSAKQSKVIDPNECDWESLYDDSGECLVPSLMEELTKSVGKVRVTSADSDYRAYQSVEERTNDGECVIEIYDFPAEFKTTDLNNVFAAYINKNFQIKWVDDTHALGIFPSPLMADEVLACTLPFVKTRPLRLGIAESRNKARNLVLPPLPSIERPKTCPALAKRLVSGALGLRIPRSSQEREKEKQVLREAREKRRLEAKQREAAWDGTITSSSVI